MSANVIIINIKTAIRPECYVVGLVISFELVGNWQEARGKMQKAVGKIII